MRVKGGRGLNHVTVLAVIAEANLRHPGDHEAATKYSGGGDYEYIAHDLPVSSLVHGVSVLGLLGGVEAEQGREERLLPGHGRHHLIQALLQRRHLSCLF